MFAKTVDELVVYQIALHLAKETKDLVLKIPFHWKIEEVGQILGSSSSSPSNISEGFGVRFYPRKLILYLNNALGSSDETQNHLRLLLAKDHIGEVEARYFLNGYKNLSIKLLNWINYLKTRHNIRL
jgi:four helix bundle protein